LPQNYTKNLTNRGNNFIFKKRKDENTRAEKKKIKDIGY